MRIVEPSTTIISYTPDPIQLIERCGRVCYKSEDKITADSADVFVRRIVASGHHSALEHASVTVLLVCDRGVSHELVRHRLCAFSQESTRYCNYGKTGDVTFVRPLFWPDGSFNYAGWKASCETSEQEYLYLIQNGCSPQEARSVLPNSLKTEIMVTANFREWRHIFELRTSPKAHPQMRQVMVPLQAEFQKLWPSVFT